MPQHPEHLTPRARLLQSLERSRRKSPYEYYRRAHAASAGHGISHISAGPHPWYVDALMAHMAMESAEQRFTSEWDRVRPLSVYQGTAVELRLRRPPDYWLVSTRVSRRMNDPWFGRLPRGGFAGSEPYDFTRERTA